MGMVFWINERKRMRKGREDNRMAGSRDRDEETDGEKKGGGRQT